MKGFCFVVLLVLVPACTIFTEFDPNLHAENFLETCSDGQDNDDDGFVDCKDTGCSEQDHCKESSDATCVDGKDNDQDGLIDCKDPTCCLYAKCFQDATCGEKTARACVDGADNDGNGLTDCADFSCAAIKECCTRPVHVVAETFDVVGSGCKPADCSKANDACCKDGSTCNVFDPARWFPWGAPMPRIVNGKLTPNQPCNCPSSGLISVKDTLLSPGQQLDFEADLQGDDAGFIAVGLVENPSISPSSTCGGINNRFKLLLGVEVEANKGKVAVVRAVISESVRMEKKGVPIKGAQRFRVVVDAEGKAEFFHNGASMHRSNILVTAASKRVRLLIQGRSGVATVDNVLLARREGCLSPGSWTTGPTGAAPVLSPSEGKGDFDSASVEAPSVIHDGTTYRLYYSATSAKDQKQQIGVALSQDGHNWAKSPPVTVTNEQGHWLSDPCVIPGRQYKYLMAYRSQSPTSQPEIALATSLDGQTWVRMATAVTTGPDDRWDGKDVSGPAMAFFGPPDASGKPIAEQLHLWYVGSGSEAKHLAPALGLAVADSAFKFTKQVAINPVLSPKVGQHDDRGVTDPWVLVVDVPTSQAKVLRLWYAGRLWTGTGINLATSMDGRSWVRYANNPVIRHSDHTFYGSASVRGPTVLDRWGTLHLWYGGTNPAGKPSIGYAVNFTR